MLIWQENTVRLRCCPPPPFRAEPNVSAWAASGASWAPWCTALCAPLTPFPRSKTFLSPQQRQSCACEASAGVRRGVEKAPGHNCTAVLSNSRFTSTAEQRNRGAAGLDARKALKVRQEAEISCNEDGEKESCLRWARWKPYPVIGLWITVFCVITCAAAGSCSETCAGDSTRCSVETIVLTETYDLKGARDLR